MQTNFEKDLKEIYRRYGFDLAKKYEDKGVLVFTIRNGYFVNADIVPVSEDADPSHPFQMFTDSGYACTVRKLQTPRKTEEDLFKGFFSVDAIIGRLKQNYNKFAQTVVSNISSEAKYEYINAPYRINDTIGIMSPADEVISRLDSKKPTLFLIEAAAGFGKTCTAYELVNALTENEKFLPLFSELSRNRQASIFRYILLDEIDRTFPVLSSKLVQSEMKNGRVVTILDGFDELLRKNEDGSDFEKQEPMLETIGEFLTGQAKIVLTTRRTVLFEGDAFHRWADEHCDDFDLVRIRISEPKVSDWLGESRLSALQKGDFELSDLANPVLLSYLRCITDSHFDEVSRNIENIVHRYFQFMLDREKVRQDLQMSEEGQEEVLRTIAGDMIEKSYTSEHRDYIVDLILRKNYLAIDNAIKTYPPSNRPSREGVANKLASHALLDRSQSDQSKISFVNDFVLGNFVSSLVVQDDEWLNDDMRFIEPAVLSYQPRGAKAKKRLYRSLNPSMEYLSVSDRVYISSRLISQIPFEIQEEEVTGLTLSGLRIGDFNLNRVQFNDCTFKGCVFDVSKMKGVTFLNCRYFGNSFADENAVGEVHVFGGFGDQSFIDKLSLVDSLEKEVGQVDVDVAAERFVLEKFWPIGRDTISHKHRPIKGICSNSGDLSQEELYTAIASLKKKDVLRVPNQASFVEINFDEIVEIRRILGRGA